MDNLVQEGAASITFDVHFIEPRNPEDDQLFAAALKKAGNVIIGEPLVTREIDANADGGGQAQPGIHSIVKIVKPIELFAKAAVATAPFSLPRIPFKVNQYWGFQTGAGDSPTLPVVTFQLLTLPLYDEFLSLLKNVSPQKAAALPPYRLSRGGRGCGQMPGSTPVISMDSSQSRFATALSWLRRFDSTLTAGPAVSLRLPGP